MFVVEKQTKNNEKAKGKCVKKLHINLKHQQTA